MRAVSLCLVLFLAVVPAASVLEAVAAEPAKAAPAACVAARDKALNRLDEAALAIETAIDSDVAIAGSPEYELLQAKKEQVEEIDGERRAVWARFNRCAGLPPSSPAQ